MRRTFCVNEWVIIIIIIIIIIIKSLFILETIKAKACKIAEDKKTQLTHMHTHTIIIGLLEYEHDYHWTV